MGVTESKKTEVVAAMCVLNAIKRAFGGNHVYSISACPYL